MKQTRTCAFPALKHPGRPVRAENFEIRGKAIFVRCPETGRYFEAKVSLARYKCCPNLVWVEKDYINLDPKGKVQVTIDLTREPHE